jgi:hypothetical protein
MLTPRSSAGFGLVVVMERVLVGSIEGCSVYQLAKVLLASSATTFKAPTICVKVTLLDFTSMGKSEKEDKGEESYRKPVKQLLRDGSFYFSYDLDLTNTLLSLLSLSEHSADELLMAPECSANRVRIGQN